MVMMMIIIIYLIGWRMKRFIELADWTPPKSGRQKKKHVCV
jgi:hypothetical protein